MRLMQAEGEQDRLLQPLMHHPAALALLGHSELAFVEEIENLLDRVAHHAFGLRRDLGGMFVGAIDESLEMIVGHGGCQVRQNWTLKGIGWAASVSLLSSTPMAVRNVGSASVRWWIWTGSSVQPDIA